MKNTLETRLGMFVALALIAGYLILFILGGRDIFKPGYHLRARFNNIQDLKVGDAVKMAGVPVGRVEKIELTEGKVEVDLKLNKDAPVHTDSKATIKFTGLMGQYYVSIDFGSPSAPHMEQNQLIATTEQPDLGALIAKLDDVATGVQNLTKSFTGDKIDNLLGPFTDFMRQNNPKLTAIIGNVQGISAHISEGQTTATMTNLKEITQKINSGQGTVGKIINDQEFYKNAKLSLQKLDKATEGLEDSGPLSLLGQVITTLF